MTVASNQRSSLAISLFVIGSMCLMFYWMILGFEKIGPIEVDGRDIGIVIFRSEHPLGFLVVEATILIVALIFYFISAFVFFKKPDIRFMQYFPIKKGTPYWRILNIGCVLLAVWGGYGSLSPERLKNTNPDFILCLIILIIMSLFSIGTVAYSFKACKCEGLRTPSWDRNPFNWWYDPLQSLFMSTWIMSAMALGSMIRMPAYGSTGFWTFGVYFCWATGTAIGQLFVYKIFRDRIVKA